jgi:hypothetical protein
MNNEVVLQSSSSLSSESLNRRTRTCTDRTRQVRWSEGSFGKIGVAYTASTILQVSHHFITLWIALLWADVRYASRLCRYNDQWSRTVTNAVFLAVFANYLKTERLLTVEELEELTGGVTNGFFIATCGFFFPSPKHGDTCANECLWKSISCNICSLDAAKVDLDNSQQDFHISIEEFLHSYISLTGELVSLDVLNGCSIQMNVVSTMSPGAIGSQRRYGRKLRSAVPHLKIRQGVVRRIPNA